MLDSNWVPLPLFVARLVASILLISLGLCISGCRGKGATSKDSPSGSQKKVRVEVVSPKSGGMLRSSLQPGTAHSYEAADLFPKVSGFLKSLSVDIGSLVKAGEVLAELDVPELQQDILAAEAALKQSEAEIAQAEAQVQSVEADQKSAEAKVLQAKSEQRRIESEVRLAEKQLARTQELNQLRAIEERIVDEKIQQLASVEASLTASKNAVRSAEQDVFAATARIALAKSQLKVTMAKYEVAQSNLQRSKVMASYTTIVSPYDGVITARNFHRGAYIRSPDHGGDKAILSVDRTDLMRVILRIPDRDVPYVHKGDMCSIRFDAFPALEFPGPIARIAATEDSATRTMAVEIDVNNPDVLIRDQRYGRVHVALEEASTGHTIPSTCLVGDARDGKGNVFVVVDGILALKSIHIGRDTGVETEVLSGLKDTDQVVARPANGLANGRAVEVVPSGAVN